MTKLREEYLPLRSIEPEKGGSTMHFSDKDPTDLGNILTGLGFASKDAIQGALDSQESMEVLMGRFLVSQGLISESQLQEALRVQQDLRSRDKVKRAMATADLAIQSRSHVQDVARALPAKAGLFRATYLAKVKAR